MHAMVRIVRDIWCAMRSTCRVAPPPDETLAWLERQEAASDTAIDQRRRQRQRRQNAFERLAIERRAREARRGTQ